MPELLIYDEIGYWGLTAKQFSEELKALGDVPDLVIGINTPGGEIDDGAAIYNLLKQHPARITMRVDGACWSCGTLIAMAGDTIQMAENATFMIHGPRAQAMDNTIAGHEECIKVLKKFEAILIDVYQKRTGLERELIESWMMSDNWFSASEAQALKLVDEVLENKLAAAAFGWVQTGERSGRQWKMDNQGEETTRLNFNKALRLLECELDADG